MFIVNLFNINRLRIWYGSTNGKTEYSVILNSGSCFVFTFKDPDTNVGIYRINME